MRTLLTVCAAMITVIMFVAMLATGCSKSEEPKTGRVSQAEVTATSLGTISAPGGLDAGAGTVNLSADWSVLIDEAGAPVQRTAIAFDQNIQPVGNSGEAATQWVAVNPLVAPAWAWSDTGLAGSFTACAFNIPACNAGFTVLPPGGSGTDRWRGRGSLASDRMGTMVYVALYDRDFDVAAEGVAAVVSHDGGMTFGVSSADIVDVTPSKVGQDCETGKQDMPHASWDFTFTPPRLRVVWRHKGGGSFGGCIRSFQLNAGVLTPLGGAARIDQMDRQGSNDGQAMKVRSADGVITVVYQNADIPEVCPSAKTKELAWGSVTSSDEGTTWTEHAEITSTKFFQWCTPDGKIQRGVGEWDFVIAPDGNAYVVVNEDDSTMSLWMSPTRGVKPRGSNAVADWGWRKYCNTASDTPWQNQLKKGQLCASPFTSTGSLLHPVLAASGNSQLSLAYVEKKALFVRTNYFGNVLPRAYGYSGPFGLSQNTAGVFQRPQLPSDGGTGIAEAPFISPAHALPTQFGFLSLGSQITMTPVATKTEPRCNAADFSLLAPFWVIPSAAMPTNVIEFRQMGLTPP